MFSSKSNSPMCSNKLISQNNFADLMGVSRRTVQNWLDSGHYRLNRIENGVSYLSLDEICDVPEISQMLTGGWEEDLQVFPHRAYSSIELFAGGGGLALGLEQAGFHHLLLNEFEHNACETLRLNRPKWEVLEGDIHNVDFTPYRDKVDLLSGGFPCQAFSFAGKRLGFEETRGTLFFELARAVSEIRPKVLLCENVKGLQEHDNGRTLSVIADVIDELGYKLVPPRVLKAIMYKVPQKRERLILVAIRKDLVSKATYRWPSPYHRVMTLRDAFFAGELYSTDVPDSEGQQYPEKKKKVMALVPMGGDWRDLPEEVAKEYMMGSYYLGGGKTGMARRLSLDEASLTLTCAPAQKQTERCHPLETRPLTVREYARIQTFPDDWTFAGNISSQYKQIGNAVPVNMASAIGRSLIRLLNDIEEL